MEQTFSDALRKVVTGVLFVVLVVLGAVAFNVVAHLDTAQSTFVTVSNAIVNVVFIYMFIVTLIRISSNSKEMSKIIDSLNTKGQLTILNNRIDSLRDNQANVRERIHALHESLTRHQLSETDRVERLIKLWDLRTHGVDLTKKTAEETAAVGVDLTAKA